MNYGILIELILMFNSRVHVHTRVHIRVRVYAIELFAEYNSAINARHVFFTDAHIFHRILTILNKVNFASFNERFATPYM